MSNAARFDAIETEPPEAFTHQRDGGHEGASDLTATPLFSNLPDEQYEVFENENDEKPVGVEKSWLIHKTGLLHRAVFAWVFNSKKELLLTRRSPNQIIFPDRWDATIATHPLPGESTQEAARRALQENLGVTGIELPKHLAIPRHTVRVPLPLAKWQNNMLVESIIITDYDGTPIINKETVADATFLSLDAVRSLTSTGGAVTFTDWCLKELDHLHWFKDIWPQGAPAEGEYGRGSASQQQPEASSKADEGGAMLESPEVVGIAS